MLLDSGRPAPLMLLDDVTSELDLHRRELLVEHLSGGGQALITATESEHLPASAERHEVAVREGHAIADAAPPGFGRGRGCGVTPRAQPRAFGEVVAAARRRAAPETPLAAAQGAWAEAVGERIARESRPVAERDGRLTVECRTAAWAQELDLLQTELLGRLAGRSRSRTGVEALRFRVAGPWDYDTVVYA